MPEILKGRYFLTGNSPFFTVKGDDAKTVLVFDFGGGTFDLSVLTISGGQFIEQGTSARAFCHMPASFLAMSNISSRCL